MKVIIDLELLARAILLSCIFCLIIIGFCYLIVHNIRKWHSKRQQKRKQKAEQDEFSRSMQKKFLRQQLYFYRKTGKIADQYGHEPPELKNYSYRLAPMFSTEDLPDKAFAVLFEQVCFSENQKKTIIFKPDNSGWIFFKVEGFVPDNKVILSHPVLGTLCLLNTERQAETTGQMINVFLVTVCKDGVYNSFCHIPSKKPFSLT